MTYFLSTMYLYVVFMYFVKVVIFVFIWTYHDIYGI